MKMTEEEFDAMMEDLENKGLIVSRVREDGETEYKLTDLGREVTAQFNEAENIFEGLATPENQKNILN
jgi:DNA-binding PadR family transcriptional regulator